MTKAAERFPISQPSMSQAIRELEEEFGSAPFERLLLGGDLGLALVEGETRSPSLVRTHFYQDRLKIVCSPENPAWKRKMIPRDLRARGLYIRAEGSGPCELFVHAMRKKGNPFRVAGELGNTEALKNILRADRAGFSVISELALDPSLRVLEVPGLNFERSIDIVPHKDKRMGGVLADLVDDILRSLEISEGEIFVDIGAELARLG